MTPAGALKALEILLSSRYVNARTATAASGACAALRSPALAFGLCRQAARQGTAQRRHAALTVVEAAPPGGAPGGSSSAAASGGSAGSTGVPLWEPVAAALDRRQPEAAWREFMRVLEGGVLPPAPICDRLISALCAKQRFRDAWRAYAAVQPSGLCLSYNTYQALISQALKVGEVEAALEVFRGLRQLGLSPNVVTYCGLIAALGRERRRGTRAAATAAELWGELVASGAQLDVAAYRTGIKACVDVGRLHDASRLLKEMAAAGLPPDVRAYNTLLSGHARAGAVGPMTRLLQRMVAAGVEPSVVTFNTLLDGYVRARDLGAARGVLARAVEAGVALDAWTYSTLIKGYVQAGQLAAAETVLGDMAAAGVRPTCVTFTTLLDGHVRAGDMAAARRVLQAMVAAGEAPNAITYNSLLRGYATAAATAAATVAATRTGAAPSGGTGGGGGSGGATEGADAPASGGVAVAAPAPAASSLASALEVLGEMQARGVAPATDTFNTLMAAAVGAGEPQLALDLQQRLKAAGLRADALTYTTLIKAHARLGQVSEAAAAFEALLRDRSAAPDVRAYNAMVDALARNGDMAAAERMLSAAADFASKQGLPAPVEAYGAIVAGYARELSVAPAVAAVRRFHAADGSPDAQMLDVLANMAIRAGEYKVAMQSVRALELIGRDVDKGKYATLLQEVAARQAASAGGEAAAEPTSGHNRTWAAYQQKREAKQRNVALERFKFWLGLPNRYYSDASDSDAEGESEPAPAEEWDGTVYEQRRWGDGPVQ